MKDALRIITIYNSPLDFPGLFVAREFFVKQSEIVRGNVIVKHRSLEHVRNILQGLELTRINRQDNDEPQIVESWL